MTILIVLIVAAILLIVYSCCKVAGECAREEEKLEKEWGLDK